MIKKVFLFFIIIASYCIHADFDHNKNIWNHQFSTYLQANSGDSRRVFGHGNINIFSQQSVSYANSIPTFEVSSQKKINESAQKTNTQKKSQEASPIYYLVAPNGQKEAVSKERFDKELALATNNYVQLLQGYFGVDMNVLAPMVKKAFLQGIINTSDMRNQLIHQAITHIVKTGQTQAGIIDIYSNYPWVIDKDLSHVTVDEQIMINYVISRLAYCNNSNVIELAQGCLQAFEDVKKSQTEDQRKAYQEICNSCYLQLLNNSNVTSKVVTLYENSMQSDLVSLYYDAAGKIDAIYDQINSENSEQLKGYREKYLHRLLEREAIVFKTLQNDSFFTELTNQNFSLSAEVVGYCMAHNLNYGVFNNQRCIYFQHFLTHEIVNLLEKNITRVGYSNNDMIAQYIKELLNIAVTAQQLNQDYQIKLAVALADLSEFFSVLGETILDSSSQLGIGLALGIKRSLDSWLVFAYNMTTSPLKTIQDGVEVLKDLVDISDTILETVVDVLPESRLKNIEELTIDWQDFDDMSKLPPPHSLYEDVYAKYQPAQQGLLQAIRSTRPVIEFILERPARENIADVTQCVVDGIVINKIAHALSYVANFGKIYLSKVTQTMSQSFPGELLQEPVCFATTSTGQVLVHIEKTGQSIADAAIATAAGLFDGTMQATKYIAQGKILSDKVQQLTNADKEKIAELQTLIEPYLRCDKIINVDRLKTIEGIDQIDNFKRYTNNFTNLEKLTEQEILYLNLCDWLEPQVTKINTRLKNIGGLKFIDPISKTEVVIEKYDLFHSLLGEMTPGNLKKCVSGGHLPLLELRAATLEIGEMKSFGNGFFDMGIKVKSNRKLNAYFPLGTTVEEAVGMIEDGLANIDKIKNVTPSGRIDKLIYEISDYQNQVFKIYVENNKVQFHPLVN